MWTGGLEVHLCDPQLAARLEQPQRLGGHLARRGGRELVDDEGEAHHVDRATRQARRADVSEAQLHPCVRVAAPVVDPLPVAARVARRRPGTTERTQPPTHLHGTFQVAGCLCMCVCTWVHVHTCACARARARCACTRAHRKEVQREVEPEHRGGGGPVGGEAARRDARAAAEVDHRAARWHGGAERGQRLVEGAAERQLAVRARLRKVARSDSTWQRVGPLGGAVGGPGWDEVGWAARRLERGRLTRSDLALEGGLPAEVARFVRVEGLAVVLGHGHALLLGLRQLPWAARLEPR